MADWTAGSPSGPLSASRYGAPSAPRTNPGGLSGASRPGAYPFAQRASAALDGLDGSQGGMGRARLALWAGGGVLSLALVAGIGVWGYKLVLRDVLGVPVVEVAEGPMRVAPADPGGAVAAHQGLAVNAVAAAGEAEAPSDVLTLAPPVPALAAEDMTTVQTTAEAGEPVAAEAPSLDVTGVTPTSAPPAGGETMTAEQVQAFADRVAAGAAPLGAPLGDLAAPAADADADAAAAAAAPIPESVPGVATAMRPPARPAGAVTLPAVTLTASAPTDPALIPQASGTSAAAPADPAEVALTADIPAGTSLVQLGAFDSPEVAAAEWDRLSAEFADFIGGRERVIQEAESGGRTFFRLRATGFADLGDARRFCAALVAEDAGCIPVVVN